MIFVGILFINELIKYENWFVRKKLSYNIQNDSTFEEEMYDLITLGPQTL